MDNLDRHIKKFKKRKPKLAETFDIKQEAFKPGNGHPDRRGHRNNSRKLVVYAEKT